MDKTPAFEFGGHKFYSIDPAKMPLSRSTKLTANIKVLDYGMTKETVNDLANRMEMLDQAMLQALVDADSSKAVKINQQKIELTSSWRDVVNMELHRKPLAYLASMVILIDDEDPQELDPDYEKLKLKLCGEHEEIEDFFLSYIMPLLGVMYGLKDFTKTWELLTSQAVKANERIFYSRLESR